ncbi:MAG TPA: hypothetical protein VHL53_13400 [Acidimicrobiia bacterium]|nr:hypothetical protein [Acidimicrobiia bacterium]
MKQRPFRSWSEHRPRLLIEDPSPALELAEFRTFEESGFDVALCSGPGEDDGCPLAAGGDCPLVDGADVVIMGPGMAAHRAEVSEAIHRRRPDLPVVVQVPPHDRAECPPGCIPAGYPSSVDGQVRSVWRALDRGAPAPAPAPSGALTPTEARLIDLLGW